VQWPWLLRVAQHERWTAGKALAYSAAGAVVLGGLYSLFKLALQVPLP